MRVLEFEKKYKEEADYQAFFKSLRTTFGSKFDNDEVTWYEIGQNFDSLISTSTPAIKIEFQGILSSMQIVERQRAQKDSRKNPMYRVQNQAPRREEESGADRHAGFKRGVDSASERESERHKSKVEGLMVELDGNRKGLLKLHDDLRDYNKQIQLLQAKRTETEQQIKNLEQTVIYHEKKLDELLHQKNSKPVDLTTDDDVMERIPVSFVQDLRDIHAGAAEGRRQTKSDRGKQPAVGRAGRDIETLFRDAVVEAIRANIPSRIFAGIQNNDVGDQRVMRNMNICWLSSGLKFLCAIDLDDNSQVHAGPAVHNLKSVKNVLLANSGRVVYPSQESVFRTFDEYVRKTLQYNPREGGFNDVADLVSLVLDADPGSGLSQLLNNPHTKTTVVDYLNDDGTFAENIRNENPFLQVIDVFANSLEKPSQLKLLFHLTENEDRNGNGQLVETITALKINVQNNYLIFRVKRQHGTNGSPNPLPTLVAMDETLSPNDSTYSLLAFIIRPSSVHYTMAMKAGSVWWLHDDQRVTKITDGIKQFESTATCLLYKRIQ